MTHDPVRSLIYTLLALMTLATTAARIVRTELVVEPSMYRGPESVPPFAPTREWPQTRPTPMPTLSSNDRSRWCTVRALVDHGTFVIGHRRPDPTNPSKFIDEGIVFENGWQTVDKVKNPQTDDYYSSKPPLLTLVAAGEYWLLKHLLGWSIVEDPNKVVKTILLTLNLLPLALFLRMIRNLLEVQAESEWTRLFLFVSACAGTFLTTFAITLNNHTPAAVLTLGAVYPFLRSTQVSSRFLGRFPVPPVAPILSVMGAGLCAGLMACLELPALSLLVALGVAVGLSSPVRGLAYFAVAIPVLLSELALNKVAVNEWMPIYSKFGGPWYEYPGSHWLKPPAGQIKYGIDWARHHESWAAYVFHCVIGHHGLFSLTPIWLFSLAALCRRTWRCRVPQPGPKEASAFLYPLTLIVSATVVAYYMYKSTNYGGNTSGLRWLIWLTPLWLVSAPPAVERLSRSGWGRRIAYGALAVSVFSASYSLVNPWRHPWLYHLLETVGMIHYGG